MRSVELLGMIRHALFFHGDDLATVDLHIPAHACQHETANVPMSFRCLVQRQSSTIQHMLPIPFCVIWSRVRIRMVILGKGRI
jgi:hypothetical protein